MNQDMARPKKTAQTDIRTVQDPASVQRPTLKIFSPFASPALPYISTALPRLSSD